MMATKKQILITLAICLAALLCGSLIFDIWSSDPEERVLKIGFIYENDESTPYTYNFYLAQRAVEKEFGSRVEVFSRNNVLDDETDKPIRELIGQGCGLIFSNSYSTQVMSMAAEYPSVQFCQVSFRAEKQDQTPENYHTFKGAVYQGRYLSGIVAGLKLEELIDSGELKPENALIGYVAAMPTAEVISGYTAFLLGIRSVVPEAVMRVRYTGTWSNYSLEKKCASALIEEGCVVIGQHTDTIGPAVACEDANAAGNHRVFHVGYNQSMIDAASSTSLTSTRINWTPYVTGAVQAVLDNRPIEQVVKGKAWGRDMSAGLDLGWVEILERNESVVAAGTEERLQKEIRAFSRGETDVFRGDYIGVNPDDPSDTIDLKNGFTENASSSSPSFAYILRDIITVE